MMPARVRDVSVRVGVWECGSVGEGEYEYEHGRMGA
jgi:hypothetical protein